MQASILQRILVIIFLLGAVVLGLVVASGFLIFALLLVPVFLVRFWLHKKQFEKVVRAQQAQYRATSGTRQGAGRQSAAEPGFGHNSEHRNSGAAAGGATIEGEVVKKSEAQPSQSDPER